MQLPLLKYWPHFSGDVTHDAGLKQESGDAESQKKEPMANKADEELTFQSILPHLEPILGTLLYYQES